MGGLARDEARAAALYEQGCNGGDAHGCTNLGSMILQGSGGLAPDRFRAAALFKRGCDAGHEDGCKALAALPR